MCIGKYDIWCLHAFRPIQDSPPLVFSLTRKHCQTVHCFSFPKPNMRLATAQPYGLIATAQQSNQSHAHAENQHAASPNSNLKRGRKLVVGLINAPTGMHGGCDRQGRMAGGGATDACVRCCTSEWLRKMSFVVFFCYSSAFCTSCVVQGWLNLSNRFSVSV